MNGVSKKAKSIISNNLDWTESTALERFSGKTKPCKLNVMRIARAGEDVITKESKSAR